MAWGPPGSLEKTTPGVRGSPGASEVTKRHHVAPGRADGSQCPGPQTRRGAHAAPQREVLALVVLRRHEERGLPLRGTGEGEVGRYRGVVGSSVLRRSDARVNGP